MAKNINKDVVYRAAKSKEKDYMINDGGGLFLFVGKNGTKSSHGGLFTRLTKSRKNWHLVFIQMSH